MFDRKTRHIISRAMGRILGQKQMDDRLAGRVAEAQQIAKVAVNGKVAVVFAGMDCDGVQYSGTRYVVPATLTHVDHCVEMYNRWADGPYSYRLASPTEKVTYTSRDLGMEAHENGHPHVLRP